MGLFVGFFKLKNYLLSTSLRPAASDAGKGNSINYAIKIQVFQGKNHFSFILSIFKIHLLLETSAGVKQIPVTAPFSLHQLLLGNDTFKTTETEDFSVEINYNY